MGRSGEKTRPRPVPMAASRWPPIGTPGTAGRGRVRALGPVLATVIAASWSVTAPADHDPNRLTTLLDEDRFEQAWTLASEQLAAHGGEPRFDFYYGLAAIETGHLAEAVFALERVLMANPGFDRARLELARALFLQEDDLRARRQFEIVLAHQPPPSVAAAVERYLAAMDRRADRYRTTVTGWLETEVGHDDNVNRAPDLESVDLGFGTLLLDQSQQGLESAFLRVAGDARVSRPLQPGLNAIAAVGGEVRGVADESQFNTQLGHGRAGLRHTRGPHQLSAFLQAYSFYVDGEAYQDGVGLTGSWLYELGERTSLQATGRLTQLSYDTQDVRDSRLVVLGGGVSHQWTGSWNPVTRVSLLLGEEDPDDDSVQARGLASRDIRGLQLWLGANPAASWSLQASLLYRNSEYETNVFPFSEARDEDYYSLDLALDWHPNAHWRVGPHIEYSDNSANIELYDYERAVVGVRARYTFF